VTKKELLAVKQVLENIKPRENGLGQHGKVLFALSLINKDLALRQSQKDNIKNMYDYENQSGF